VENKYPVYTAGSFDILHIGHIRFLKKCKQIAESIKSDLIVGVSTDKLIKKYKKTWPIMPYKQRAEIIMSLKYVDHIVEQKELIDIKLLKKLKPSLIITVSDWKNLPGIKWAIINCIPVIYLPYTKGISSTSIKKRLK